MTEIEQLRAAIATLEAAKKDIDRISAAYFPPGYWREIAEHAITTELKERLAKLEAEAAAKNAEANRWKSAKHALATFERHVASGADTATVCVEVLHYIRHLESKASELEIKLETRSGGPGAIVECNNLSEAQARIAELETQLASEKQRAADFDLASHCLSSDLKKAQARIAELEAEMKETKNEAEQQEAWAATFDSLRIRAENEQRRLEGELAKRPVVYCMKNNLTGIYGKHFGLDRIALFDIENPEVLAEWQSEPYTGEQS